MNRDVITYSESKDQAARLVAGATLRGDWEVARRFALEFAIHRDAEETRAEAQVVMAGLKERLAVAG